MKYKEIITKIKKLPKKKIDELFYKCGWIDAEKGKNKALPNKRINAIKKGKGDGLIKIFIEETGPNLIFAAIMEMTN